MRITTSYQISFDLFKKIYRVHCHYKFHIRRSMILSMGLLIFGLIMEKGYGKDFGWINAVVFVLCIISILCNMLCDCIMPKYAYRLLADENRNQGIITITEEALIFGEGRNAISKKWSSYDSCIETQEAFLLYQKDLFTILVKSTCDNRIDDVRDLLTEKVNKGKPMKMKK